MGGADDAMLTAGFQNATVYDSWTRTWTATTAMVAGRWAFGAVALADGRVLAVGGTSRTGVASTGPGEDVFAMTAEVFTS